MTTLTDIYNQLPKDSLGKLYILNNDKSYFNIKEFNRIFIKSLTSLDSNEYEYLLSLYIKYIDQVFELYLDWVFKINKDLE